MEEMPRAIYSGAIVLQEIVLERVSWQQKSKGGRWAVGGVSKGNCLRTKLRKKNCPEGSFMGGNCAEGSCSEENYLGIIVPWHLPLASG